MDPSRSFGARLRCNAARLVCCYDRTHHKPFGHIQSGGDQPCSAKLGSICEMSAILKVLGEMSVMPMETKNSSLQSFVSQSSFMRPKFMPPVTAWGLHAPFAFWLVENLKPDSIVELGTYYGFSFFCFCQQVVSLKLPTSCIAVDTWAGDEHAGFYDESVFNMVTKINAADYSSFTRLLRATFDEAVGQFSDGSIDLLHVDGRHRYEDVKHDFESWRSKLSNRSVVLFHDTQVHDRDFGVYRFWTEISKALPHFEFTHGFGLGVLGFGYDVCPALRPLFDASQSAEMMAGIRSSYERLGMVLAGNPISRNEPCPCGSAQRYKHCCGSFVPTEIDRTV